MRMTGSFFRAIARLAKPRAARPVGRRLSILVLAVAAVTSGCAGLSSLSNDSAISDAVAAYRFRNMSSKSWHRHKHIYCNEPCLNDFCAGYRQGYEDVANGANGCTPAFPPREYWGWQFQSAYGQRRVAAWFAGYPHGAKAAEEEGISNWHQIQMSTRLQSEYVNAGVLPNQGCGVYPITDSVGTGIGAPTPVPGMPAAGPDAGVQPQLNVPLQQAR